MPRRRRNELAGATFHVSARGVEQGPIFRDDTERMRFLRLLSDVIDHEQWAPMTYCLMSNHYHLVIRLREPNLSEGMQRLNGGYARWFNDRHARPGHVFEKRFWSEIITREAHLLGLARYVALNPVRAGLCRNPGDWPWSAHRALVEGRSSRLVDVEAMLGHFDPVVERGRLAYARMVEGDGCHPAIDVTLATVLADPNRDRALARAHHELGYPVVDIAAALNCHPKTVRRRLAAVGQRGLAPLSGADTRQEGSIYPPRL